MKKQTLVRGNMDVVYITDENYVMPTCVSVVSLYENVKDNLNVYILCHSISERSKRMLHKLKNPNHNLILIDVENGAFDELSKKGDLKPGFHVSKSALFKFVLPEILENLHKVLYLDSDVAVCCDISELWDTKLDGYYVAAVERPFYDENELELRGIRGGYFNSGVMLMNLSLMRKEHLSSVLIEYRGCGVNKLMDQDTFNYVMQGRFLKLSYKYNFGMRWYLEHKFNKVNSLLFNNEYDSESDMFLGQSIVHFSSSCKPWKYYIPYFSEIFMKYYKISPYGNKTLEISQI